MRIIPRVLKSLNVLSVLGTGAVIFQSYFGFNSCIYFVSVLLSPLLGSAIDSPQLSPFGSKCPLSVSTSFQMSTLSLPSQAPSSPVLSEGGSARLEEEEELRRKVYRSSQTK